MWPAWQTSNRVLYISPGWSTWRYKQSFGNEEWGFSQSSGQGSQFYKLYYVCKYRENRQLTWGKLDFFFFSVSGKRTTMTLYTFIIIIFLQSIHFGTSKTFLQKHIENFLLIVLLIECDDLHTQAALHGPLNVMYHWEFIGWTLNFAQSAEIPELNVNSRWRFLDWTWM